MNIYPHSTINPLNLLLIKIILLIAISACSVKPVKPVTSSQYKVIKNDKFVILVAQKSDTFESLAEKYLGDASKAWMISDFNKVDKIVPGHSVVIPLRPNNPVGVFANGYQTVPILCYHRFGLNGARMVVKPEDFAEQMAYLKNNDYRVIPLSWLVDFFRGKRAIPKRSVVITIDDGHKSAFLFAYPILRKYKFPATIFVYSDYIGLRGGLTWEEMSEMTGSGLIDIQPHSKSHSNLGIPQPNEDQSAFHERIEQEIDKPYTDISTNLGNPLHTYAYPFGDANDYLIERLEEKDFRMGVTVQPGTNSVYAYPYLVKRNMVFGDHDMRAFRSFLKVFTQVNLN